MSLTVVTAAAIDPVTPQEAKRHLCIEQDEHEDDGYIANLIKAATRQAEIDTDDRQLITATYDWKMDRFPPSGIGFRVPKPPLQSVTSITYLDSNGDSQTLASSKYDVDASSLIGRIVEAPDEQWPDTELGQIDAVTIRIVTGYGSNTTDVPEPIRLGMLHLVELWYCSRGPVVAGSISVVPMGVAALFAGQRAGTYS